MSSDSGDGGGGGLPDEQADALLDQLAERADERDDIDLRPASKRQISRRGLLGAVGVAGAGALTLASQNAEAQTGQWSNASGQAGTQDKPFSEGWVKDLHSESIDAGSVSADVLTNAPQLREQQPAQASNIHTYRGVGATLGKEGPVLTPSDSGWDSDLVESCFPFFNERTQRFEMLYTGHSGSSSDPEEIGHATSYNGTDWTKNGSNPVFSNASSGWDSGTVTGPFLWWEGWGDSDTVYMYYIGSDQTGYEDGTKQHGLATTTWSDFPTGWTRNANNPIIETGQAAWRQTAIWKSSIIRDGDTYYLFFNATGDQDNEQIGYATSTDLETWTVDDANSPVLERTSGWEGAFVSDPWVIRRGDRYLMYYYGFDGSVAQNGVAYADEDMFPTEWDRHDANPILRNGVDGRFDDVFAHKPKVVHIGGEQYHYYTSVGNEDPRQISLARTSETGIKEVYRHYPAPVPDHTQTSTSYASVPESGLAVSANDLQLNGTWADVEARIVARGTMDTSGETGYVALSDTNGNFFHDDATAAELDSTNYINSASEWVPVNELDTDGDLPQLTLNTRVTGGELTLTEVQTALRRRSML